MASSDFLTRWQNTTSAERAVYQQFFTEFCAFLGVDAPDPQARERYCFEKSVRIPHDDGTVTTRRADFYKEAHFVIEAKQGGVTGQSGTAVRGTPTWERAMRAAYAQAINYAHYFPEGRPPFVITVDIGHVFEVWTGFSGHYGDYGARRTIPFSDLAKPEMVAWFRAIFTDPHSLDPALLAARVTREVAADLAELAKSLELAGHPPEAVSAFLMRCIFTMFAEDIHLLEDDLFTHALRDRWVQHPERFVQELGQLWEAMDKGLPFGFSAKLLRFNGGLFSSREVLPLNRPQLGLLLAAAKREWSHVEPSIFGTLVERALSPQQRDSFGAHFTPRAYIERIVRPAVIEPIRQHWQAVQAEVFLLVDNGDKEPTKKQKKAAIDRLRSFHAGLCKLRILDPSCGTGNFLYVTFDLLKEIEAEVERSLADLGEKQVGLAAIATINPGQFLGLELNPRAREIADLVLWIGYLKWYRLARGTDHPPEPILRAYQNIERRDAVLEWDFITPKLDKFGKPIRVHDLKTFVKSPLTGELVPDTERGMVPVYEFHGARPTEWPDADYIVSNPPFIGNKQMRMDLGDGYAEAIRRAYPHVSGAVDYVLYWWEKAATLVARGKVRRFGFITTNSILQVQNRSVIEAHLKSGALALPWAIADHPWVEAGAAVRISMTVGAPTAEVQGGILGTVAEEARRKGKEVEGQAREVRVEYRRVPTIHADLTGGADVAGALALKANEGIASTGMYPLGQGFVLEPQEVPRAKGTDPDGAIFPFFNARDLNQICRNSSVIDFYPLSEAEAQKRFPNLFTWVLGRVKPKRDQDKRESRRIKWWIFAEPAPNLRVATRGLSRQIFVPRTARHFTFQFFPVEARPDTAVVAIASDDAFVLGVLSSRTHIIWAVESGGRLGVGNDTRYQHLRTFNPFPFPDPPPLQKQKIGTLAERLDQHRKQVQAAHPDAYLTAQYNALERRKAIKKGGAAPLTPKEEDFQRRALTAILEELHQQLDQAVAEAYGWPGTLSDEEILERLVALNSERVAEEAAGKVRYLRPELQNPKGSATQIGLERGPGHSEEEQKLSWPGDPIERTRAVHTAMSGKGDWSAAELCEHFADAREEDIEKILNVLGILGVLSALDGGRWGLRS